MSDLKLESWLKRTALSGWPAVGLALEELHYEVEGHTARVARLSAVQGRANGLDAGALEALRQGAYLHDVGKLALPVEVVLKIGSLDALEWSMMHTHPVRGARLVEQALECSPGALEVILHHHERWDGSGYPDRLRGEAIPLIARIFAVCDVYDALTSRQLYRPAWAARSALDEILVQSGKHFDPQVVETFLEMAVGQLEMANRHERLTS